MRQWRRYRRSFWQARLPVIEAVLSVHGLVHVEAAKADGRWDAAYATTQEAPVDLLAAIAANPAAQKTYDQLSAQNRFALTFRTISLKTEAARTRKIAGFVDMLAQGQTIYPQKLEQD